MSPDHRKDVAMPDTIVAWQNVSLTDTPNVENLYISGDRVYGAGTSGDNIIAGGSGSDQLYGGGGQDVLVGGSGNTIALQPVSFEGSTGLNVAGGIGGITLTPAP